MIRLGGALGLLVTVLVNSAAAQDGAAITPDAAASSDAGPAASPSPTEAPAAAKALECRPTCRAGFTCLDGSCVSACNPACATGERCSEQAECVAAASPAPVASEAPLTQEQEAPARGVRRHDGFYLRFGVGVGVLFGTRDADYFDPASSFGSIRRLTLTHDISGVAQVGELMLGGTPIDGLVVGGGAWGVNAPAPSVEGELIDDDADDTKVSFDTTSDLLSVSLIAPFLSYYPDSGKGWYATVAAGLSVATSGDEADIDDVDLDSWEGAGWGALLEGGHDFWVGEQWSFGVSARVSYVRTSKGGKDAFAAWVPAVLGSATFH